MKCTGLYAGKLNVFRHACYVRRVTLELFLSEKSLESPELRHASTEASLLTLTNTELFKPFCLGLASLGIPCAILLCVRSLRIAFDTRS